MYPPSLFSAEFGGRRFYINLGIKRCTLPAYSLLILKAAHFLRATLPAHFPLSVLYKLGDKKMNPPSPFSAECGGRRFYINLGIRRCKS